MKDKLNKLGSILLSAAFVVSTFISTSVTSVAATIDTSAISQRNYANNNISINSTDVTIYAMDDWAFEYISIPSNINRSFRLIVSGAKNVSYYLDEYEDVNISSDGLITPKITTYYWYGNYGTTIEDDNKTPTKITKHVEYGESTIIVYADDVKLEVKVNVVDYADKYAEKIMDDYVLENINNSMSTYEKIDVIAKFVADRDYDESHSSYTGLIIAGGGDCWASTSAILYMSKKAGLKAWERNGNKDYGAGSGHINAMVSDGKEYYEVEAGFAASAPRYYYIRNRSSLYSYEYNDSGGIQVYQYDGETFPSVLEIPSEINGNNVTSIAENFVQSHPLVSGNYDIHKIILPNTVKKIGERAFSGCRNLQRVDIPSSVEEIGDLAFEYCPNLASITIPKSVLTIGDRALGYLYDSEKKNGFIIYGYKNTAAEKYAKNNAFEFIALDKDANSGDTNGDGEINAKDRMTLIRYLAKWSGYDLINDTAADVNQDGIVNAKDRMILTRHLAKWQGYETLPFDK